MNRVDQLLPVEPQHLVMRMSQVLPEVPEVPRRLHRMAAGVMNTVGHDEGVARVLVEQLIRLGVQRGRGHVPDDLIDADDLAAVIVMI